MSRNRVNLTLADGDYERLRAAAIADGKPPSAFAADVLKAFLMRDLFQGSPEPSKPVPEVLERPAERIPAVHPSSLPSVDEKPAEAALNRAQRREAARLEKRRKK